MSADEVGALVALLLALGGPLVALVITYRVIEEL